MHQSRLHAEGGLSENSNVKHSPVRPGPRQSRNAAVPTEGLGDSVLRGFRFDYTFPSTVLMGVNLGNRSSGKGPRTRGNKLYQVVRGAQQKVSSFQ
jgi:hypothetical protein